MPYEEEDTCHAVNDELDWRLKTYILKQTN
jgi:hypothetical protein